MAANLPVNFPIPGESAVASYSWTDISEGTGIVNFYGYSSRNNTTITYRLTQSLPESENDTLVDQNGQINFNDYDFDLTPFNAPRKLKGQAMVTGSYSWIEGLADREAYLTATLKKWDGSTETDIGSSRTQTLTATTPETGFTFCFDLTPTSFAIGDVLRLTITVGNSAGTADNGNKSVWTINTNPTDKQLKLSVPFNIDL